MRKLLCLIVIVMLLAVPALAAADAPHIVDEADLLTFAEEEQLEAELVAVSDKLGMDIVIVTTEDTGYKTSYAYADDFYDYGGYGEDGVLVLIDMDNREITFSTTGKAIDRLSSEDEDRIVEEIVPLLDGGFYLEACLEYAQLCQDILGFDWVMTGLICLAIGLVVALIVTAIMKGQLKSVRSKSEAADYMKSGSLQVTESSDMFLYRNVSRVARPKNTGSGGSRTSSSGRSHGGGSHRF